jgi:hypothetical protein
MEATMADVTKLLELYGELKGAADNISSHRQDIASVMLPRRKGFDDLDTPDGERLYDEIFDSTPQRAARGFASAIGTMLRPEGQQWAFVVADDPQISDMDEANAWFEEVESRMTRRAFDNPKTRFRQAMGEADVDLVVFGENTVFAGENADINGMLYQTQHLKDIFKTLDENGKVDGVIRRKFMTTRQARQFFGNKAGTVVKEAEEAEKRGNERHEYVHFVLPRKEASVGGFSTQLPYSSVWVECSKKELLTEGGFHEFPFIVGRFDTTSGEDHGRGPGMVALPDSNMLQAMDESILTSAQKAVEPPIMAPDDGSFNAGNTFPGGITYYDVELAKEMGRMPVSAMDFNPRIDIGLEMQQDRREQVKEAFFKNVLALPVDGPQMTATEVIARNQEFLRELGGVFGRLESDYIAPIVERTFSVMLRNGAFPEIPEALLGQNIRFEYESPIKKTRQQVEAASARQWKDDLLLLAQVDPGVLDILNAEEYARFQADANAVPLRLTNDTETVNAIREQRQADEMEAQQAQEAMMLAEGGETVTKAISNLQPSGGGQSQ